MEPLLNTERYARLESFFSTRRFALLLAVAICICFAPVIFGFQSFFYRDFGLFGHPLAQYFRDSFWRGEIPLWNPLNNCGLPFMAQWNTMVFYPPSLIYLLLPMPWSLCLFCLLHLYFGGLGMYFLARRWTKSNFAAAFGGIVFAFSGLSLHCLMWPNNIAALAWMPWILLLAERGYAKGRWHLLPAILTGGIQFMAGAPEAFLFTWVAVAGLWLAQAISDRANFVPRFARFVVIVFGVVLLSAVQLLPLLELVKASQRTASYDTGGWAMPPWGWANLIVPLFRTTPATTGTAFQIGQAWTSSYYFGIATVWLALFAIARVRTAQARGLAYLVFISLLLALGNAAMIWPWLKAHVSALGFMRYPIKLVFLMACPITLLATIGLAEIMRTPISEWRRVARIAGGIAGFLLAAIALICWLGRKFPLEYEDVSAALVSGITRGVLLLLLSAGLFLFRNLPANRVLPVGALWLAIILGDLLTHTPWQNPTVPKSLLEPQLPQSADLRRDITPDKGRAMPSLTALQMFQHSSITNLSERYMASRLGLAHNLNLLEGIPKCDGFYSLYISPQQDLQYRLFRDENTFNKSIADSLGVALTTSPGKLFEWTTRTNYLPIISIGQAPVFSPVEKNVELMTADSFNPHAVVLLPLEAQQTITATGQALAKVTVDRYTPHDIQLKANAPGTALITISQTHYKPWKAYVDGAPAKLWRANHAFQAVEVPAGEHRVRLRYEDQTFRTGAMISGISLLLILIGAVLPQGRRAFVLSDPAQD